LKEPRKNPTKMALLDFFIVELGVLWVILIANPIAQTAHHQRRNKTYEKR